MEQESLSRRAGRIAVPVTLQALLQSSFSVADQLMTGRLGSASIAGIGLGGRFFSLFTVLVSAVAAAAGIMLAQYLGRGDLPGVSRSLRLSGAAAGVAAAAFLLLCRVWPEPVMGLYTPDAAVRSAAVEYVRIMAWSCPPAAVQMLVSTLLRCREAAVLPLCASLTAAGVNTGLNYVLIFGRLGFPALGLAGAAWATVCAQWLGCALALALLARHSRRHPLALPRALPPDPGFGRRYGAVLLPMLVCEVLWCLGENVYGGVYGHIGAGACAAMTLTAPVQGLLTGAMSGLSQAAGILTGQTLGKAQYGRAYGQSKRLMGWGWAGGAALSALLVLGAGWYVSLYRVEPEVRRTAWTLLLLFALFLPVKVQNMVLGGGILRSGGRTAYVMVIDLAGTWLVGVPAALAAAFWWKLSIPWVYAVLSLEEGVRLGMSLWVFRRRRWMVQLSS